jgi:D-3-phosphoglycerate dehydrogenase
MDDPARPPAQRLRLRVLNAIAAEGLARLPAERYEVGRDFADPAAILLRSADMHSMTIPPSVRAIGRAGAGTNNIPVAAMSARGVPVFNAPGANANAVKELVIAGMLMAARQIGPALRFVAALDPSAPDLDRVVEEGKKEFAGYELQGQTLGIVGLGRVGALVADAAIRLGMQVLGHDPEITVDAAWSLPSQVRRATSVAEVLRGAQFVSLHVPLMAATRDLVNDDNVARRYGGACRGEAETNCAVMVVDQLRAYLEDGQIANAVNFPAVSMARESPWRVAITNANVPNMLGQISTTMAQAGLNIHNMVNKSRGEMAYTLVDVDSPVADGVLQALGAIPGVLAVRYLPAVQ